MATSSVRRDRRSRKARIARPRTSKPMTTATVRWIHSIQTCGPSDSAGRNWPSKQPGQSGQDDARCRRPDDDPDRDEQDRRHDGRRGELLEPGHESPWGRQRLGRAVGPGLVTRRPGIGFDPADSSAAPRLPREIRVRIDLPNARVSGPPYASPMHVARSTRRRGRRRPLVLAGCTVGSGSIGGAIPEPGRLRGQPAASASFLSRCPSTQRVRRRRQPGRLRPPGRDRDPVRRDAGSDPVRSATTDRRARRSRPRRRPSSGPSRA